MEQNYFVSFPAQYFNMLPNFQPKSHGTMSGKKISLDIKRGWVKKVSFINKTGRTVGARYAFTHLKKHF